MNRKRIALIASTTGYQTRSFSEAAKRVDLDLVLATDRCHVLEDPWEDQALALRFEDPDGAAGILEAAGPLDGITAVGDRAAFVAAVAAERLGLRFHPASAVAAAGNKFVARERFRDAGLPTPRFHRILISDTPAGSPFYPCVLKPLGLSGSRGVIRANDDSAYRAAVERIRKIIGHEELSGHIQVESFIPGAEFALEGIVTGGRLDVVALFDKPDPLDGPFFEETIYVTPCRKDPAIQEAIFESTARAVLALGLSDGPIHAEMRVGDGQVWMLEIAARPIGGLCAKALPGLEETILLHAIGKRVAVLRVRVASGVMMIPIPGEGIYNSVSGIDEAERVPSITDVIITAKQGYRIVPLPEGKRYLGFIFARGDTSEEVERALRTAHSRLAFEILAALPVL